MPLVDVAASVRERVQRSRQAVGYRRRWGFWPPPPVTDMSGYQTLMGLLELEDIGRVPGDFVEIGVAAGGGTYQLASWLRSKGLDRRVYAIDVFDSGFDDTPASDGRTMAEIYAEFLSAGGERASTQRELFDVVTKGLDNIVVLVGDSATVQLPFHRVAFAHIDGNHSYEYVRGDFERLWPKLSPGGVVAFDDYGPDLPMVTRAVDELLAEHAAEISSRWRFGKTLALKRS